MDAREVGFVVPWILFVTTAVAFVAARYAWRREQPGARWLACAEIVAGVWTGLDLFNYVVDLPSAEVAAKSATWALILCGGVALFRFACVYTRRERWWDLARFPIAVLVGVNLLLMATDSYHRLMWPGVRWVDIGAARVPWLESGPAFFWVFRPAAYGIPIAGVVVMVIGTAVSQAFHMRQVAVIGVGALVPIAVNFALNSTTAPSVDLTPVTVVVVVAAMAWATLRAGLLDFRPVARSLLLEQLDDGVVVLDADDRVVDLNPAAERLLRCVGSVPGRAPEEIMPFWRELRVHDGDVQGAEIELNGSDAVVEVTSERIAGDEGAAVGRVVMLHDVTIPIRLVRELDAYADTVARDLKAPLAQVIRRVEVVQRTGRIGGESAEHLRAAERVSGRMSEAIEALLWFARLRSTDEVPLQALDMGSVVDAAMQRLSAAVAAAGADVALPVQWPAVVGHPIWAEEVWANYVSNAIKYGGAPPRIELGAASEDAATWRFSVRDNGPGLDAEQRARLFTERMRLEPHRAEGNGLGLSIVRRIVEKLGGRVGCDSSPGEGCTFWFTLPVSPPQVAERRSPR